MLFYGVLLIITVAFILIMYILKTQEKHIREDGAKFEEYVYKRDLRKNKNSQISSIVFYIFIMLLLIVIRIIFKTNIA